jgi:hypothetical protein
MGKNAEQILRCKSAEELQNIQEYSLANFLECRAKLSQRKGFNDLFDSHVNIEELTQGEIKKIYKSLPASKRNILTKETIKVLSTELSIGINKIFDAFYFFCLSTINDSNLMWSHYANDHYGFCIEWDPKTIEAVGVNYEESLATIKLYDFVLDYVRLFPHNQNAFANNPNDITPTCRNFTERLSEYLLIKKKEWEYEREYRYVASKGVEDDARIKDITIEHGALFTYNPKSIKSITFGVRVEDKVVDHIRTLYPHQIEFKHAIANRKLGIIKIENLP